MTELILSKSFDENQKLDASLIIEVGIVEGKSSNQIIRELEQEKLSYSRGSMLLDIRRTKSDYFIGFEKDNRTGDIERIVRELSGQSKENANQWFKNVFEPFREKYGLDSQEAFRIINEQRLKGRRLRRDAELYGDYLDRYLKEFQ